MIPNCSYNQAIDIIKAHAAVNTKDIEIVPLLSSSGKYIASDVFSPIWMPNFNASAMDGYALSSSVTKDASLENPIILDVLGVIAAGSKVNDRYADACLGAFEIMTGAIVPASTDTIIKLEDVERIDDTIVIIRPSISERHIRMKGEQWAKGDLVVPMGTLVGAKEIHSLASMGITHVGVHALQIGIFSTGSELLDSSKQTKTLGEAQVYSSNALFLHSALSKYGHVELLQTVPDEPGILKATVLDALPKFNVLVSTGGVSAGKFDYVPQLVESLGKIYIKGVQIKPGRPVLYAQIPYNGRIVDYFGLPGTPFATAATCKFILEHFLHFRVGAKEEQPLRLQTKYECSKQAGLVQFFRGHRTDRSVRIIDDKCKVYESNCWIKRDGCDPSEAKTYSE